MTTADRIAMIRAAHRRYLTREHAADRFARTIAPHLRDDTPLALDHDALDELDRSTVRERVRIAEVG